jgi:N-dimethylarginine dimethylaminohydrolase
MPAASVDDRVACVIHTIEDASRLTLGSVASRKETDAILMCDASNFEVKDVKNLFMQGQIDAVDKEKAGAQWSGLKRVFEECGYAVQVIPSRPGLEDMVFTANQVLVGQDDQSRPYVVASHMLHPSRRAEVPFFRDWFAGRGYRIVELPVEHDATPLHFEGQGDAIWHPAKKLLWGGYGHRTRLESYDILSGMLAVPVVVLRLANEKFYHLDTAFCALDENTVMIHAPAFDQTGLALIRHYFKQVLEVGEADANNFACNALALGKKVVLQKGSQDTCGKLCKLGFEPVEVDTSEFMKSGGSVYCLKMGIYK